MPAVEFVIAEIVELPDGESPLRVTTGAVVSTTSKLVCVAPVLPAASSVIQSVAPKFHYRRLSRQGRLGVRGEHFRTPQVLPRRIRDRGRDDRMDTSEVLAGPCVFGVAGNVDYRPIREFMRRKLAAQDDAGLLQLRDHGRMKVFE